MLDQSINLFQIIEEKQKGGRRSKVLGNFWKTIQLVSSVEPISSHKELKTVLKMKRFQALKHIALHEKYSFNESSLQLLLNQNLESHDLRYCNLDSAPADLLTTLLARLEIIKLRGSIKNSSMVKLFTKLKASNNLMNLYWPSADYTCLDPSLLACVLSRLDFANWDYSTRGFTPTQ